MGTPLIIDDIVIAGLRKFAEANPIRLAENERIRAGVAPPPGDRDGYHCQLPTCYKLVYSISEYAHVDKSKKPIWVRHMSMSLTKPGRIPNEHAIKLISEALGFPSLDKCQLSCENEVVEVVAPLEADPGCTQP